MINIVLITGFAQSGKSTLAKILVKLCKRDSQIISFANNVKLDLSEFINKQFGFSIFTQDKREKDIIRNIMVSYACAKRQIENDYWVNSIKEVVKLNVDAGNLVIIDDCRYFNEVKWAKDNYNTKLVHITRFDKYNNPILAPNLEEVNNNKIIESLADYYLKWPTNPNLEELEPYVNLQLRGLIEEIKSNK